MAIPGAPSRPGPLRLRRFRCAALALLPCFRVVGAPLLHSPHHPGARLRFRAAAAIVGPPAARIC
jgi:hypothetical protein